VSAPPTSLRDEVAQAVAASECDGAWSADCNERAAAPCKCMETADGVLAVLRERIEALPADYDSDWWGPNEEYLLRSKVLVLLGGAG